MTTKLQPEPKRTRPNMPDYGISEKTNGLMSWEWVDQQMAKSRNYWICSVTPDNKPHATPVWGVWIDGTLYFGCARSSRKARNLNANPQVVVHLESGDDTVIFEGTVEEVRDKAIMVKIAEANAVKYPPFKPDPEGDPGTVWYSLKPHTAFSWIEHDFPNTATRWNL